MDRPLGQLLVVDYVRPQDSRPECVVFVFDGGMLDEIAVERMVFHDGEIISASFHTLTEAPDSAIDLYASRLMVLYAAWKVEHGLPHRQEIAMVKTFVSEAFGRIVDRAVQVFGSHGIATDLPIAQWYTDARAPSAQRAVAGTTDDPFLKQFGQGVVELAQQAEQMAYGRR